MPELQDFGRIHTELLSSVKGDQCDVRSPLPVTPCILALWCSNFAVSVRRSVSNITSRLFSNECASKFALSLEDLIHRSMTKSSSFCETLLTKPDVGFYCDGDEQIAVHKKTWFLELV